MTRSVGSVSSLIPEYGHRSCSVFTAFLFLTGDIINAHFLIFF